MKFALIDGSGNPVYTAEPTVPDHYVDGQVYAGLVARVAPEIDDLSILKNRYYKNGWKIRTARPNDIVVWNNDTEQWEDQRTADELKAALVKELAGVRDRKLEGGFIWDGSTFQSDTAVSQPRLLGLFTTAIAGGIPAEGYPWRLADNTWRTLSAGDAIAVWGAFQSHMASLFAAFAAHEYAVNSSNDETYLRNYDTTSGWPV